MWIGYVFVLLTVIRTYGDTTSSNRSRQRRFLIFTQATQWGVFATVAVPIDSETGVVSVAWFFEANYYNVDNATWFEPLLGDIGDIGTVRNTEKRSIDNQESGITRTSFYKFLEGMLDKHGFPRRVCLLRAICENASAHVLHNGLLGDLLHFILTPSTSDEEDELEDCYYEAEFLGLHHNCHKYLEECKESPLDLITIHVEEIVN